jgi:RNA polymerase sigma factor for flagellar operon FliA
MAKKASGSIADPHELWAQYQHAKGTPEELDLRNQLVVHYWPLVGRIAGMAKRTLTNQDTDDLISMGVVGLVSAVERFDPDRNFKFSTYGSRRILGSIYDNLRSGSFFPRSVWKEHKRAGISVEPVLSLDEPRFTVDGEPLTRADCLVSTDELFGDQVSFDDFKDVLAQAIGRLNERDRAFICLKYYEGLGNAELGKVFGIATTRASIWLREAIGNLQHELAAQWPVGGSPTAADERFALVHAPQVAKWADTDWLERLDDETLITLVGRLIVETPSQIQRGPRVAPAPKECTRRLHALFHGLYDEDAA